MPHELRLAAVVLSVLVSALPSPDGSSVSDVIILRPLSSVTWVFLTVFGGISCLVVAIFLLERSIGAVLFCTAICVVGCYAVLGNRVRADGARVWGTGLTVRGSCWRQDLDRLLIMRGYKTRPTCRVIRKDGTTAFRIPVALFGESQLSALASYLGVPLNDLT